MEEPYAYVHIYAKKIGDNFERDIVPISCVKKFDYELYNSDQNVYKQDFFKIKRNESDKKRYCFVLYAADLHQEVQAFVTEAENNNKRFRVPRLSDNNPTLNDSSIINGEEAANAEEIANAKKKRKATNQLKKINKRQNAQALIQEYINVDTQNQNNENDSFLDNPVFPRASTPLGENILQNKDAAIRAYREQIIFLKQEVEKWKNDYETLKKNTEQNLLTSSIDSDDCLIRTQEKYSYSQYDETFNYHWTQQNRNKNKSLCSDDDNLVTLRKNIECNSLAYKRAYTCSRPSDFISIISVGIYGKEDLSNRCVRKQKNTMNQEELDPVKTEVIEEEFYNFLRTKRFTLKQIETELEKLKRYHHNSISICRKRLHKEQKEQTEIDQIMSEMERQVEDAPTGEK